MIFRLTLLMVLFCSCANNRKNTVVSNVSKCSECFLSSHVTYKDDLSIEKMVSYTGFEDSSLYFFMDSCDKCCILSEYSKMMTHKRDTVYNESIKYSAIC